MVRGIQILVVRSIVVMMGYDSIPMGHNFGPIDGFDIPPCVLWFCIELYGELQVDGTGSRIVREIKECVDIGVGGVVAVIRDNRSPVKHNFIKKYARC